SHHYILPTAAAAAALRRGLPVGLLCPAGCTSVGLTPATGPAEGLEISLCPSHSHTNTHTHHNNTQTNTHTTTTHTATHTTHTHTHTHTHTPQQHTHHNKQRGLNTCLW